MVTYNVKIPATRRADFKRALPAVWLAVPYYLHCHPEISSPIFMIDGHRVEVHFTRKYNGGFSFTVSLTLKGVGLIVDPEDPLLQGSNETLTAAEVVDLILHRIKPV